jgi:hypothetical protein
MSRTISEILGDSVFTLEEIVAGRLKAGDGDVQRNIDYINNVLSSDVEVDAGTKSSCRDVVKKAEKLL